MVIYALWVVLFLFGPALVSPAVQPVVPLIALVGMGATFYLRRGRQGSQPRATTTSSDRTAELEPHVSRTCSRCGVEPTYSPDRTCTACRNEMAPVSPREPHPEVGMFSRTLPRVRS